MPGPSKLRAFSLILRTIVPCRSVIIDEVGTTLEFCPFRHVRTRSARRTLHSQSTTVSWGEYDPTQSNFREQIFVNGHSDGCEAPRVSRVKFVCCNPRARTSEGLQLVLGFSVDRIQEIVNCAYSIRVCNPLVCPQNPQHKWWKDFGDSNILSSQSPLKFDTPMSDDAFHWFEVNPQMVEFLDAESLSKVKSLAKERVRQLFFRSYDQYMEYAFPQVHFLNWIFE